jgi:hypothetical protein
MHDGCDGWPGQLACSGKPLDLNVSITGSLRGSVGHMLLRAVRAVEQLTMLRAS